MSIKHSDWTNMYELIQRSDGQIDIILPNPGRKNKQSIRLYQYQIEFLLESYPGEYLSSSLRMAIDDLILMKNNAQRIILKDIDVISEVQK